MAMATVAVLVVAVAAEDEAADPVAAAEDLVDVKETGDAIRATI